MFVYLRVGHAIPHSKGLYTQSILGKRVFTDIRMSRVTQSVKTLGLEDYCIVLYYTLHRRIVHFFQSVSCSRGSRKRGMCFLFKPVGYVELSLFNFCKNVVVGSYGRKGRGSKDGVCRRGMYFYVGAVMNYF